MSLTGVQNELPEVSAGLLGARWAQGGRLSRPLGAVLGVPAAPLATPEAAREPPGGHFWSYFCNAGSGTSKIHKF